VDFVNPHSVGEMREVVSPRKLLVSDDKGRLVAIAARVNSEYV